MMVPSSLLFFLLIAVLIRLAISLKNDHRFKNRLAKGLLVELDFLRSEDPELDSLLNLIEKGLTARNVQVRVLTKKAPVIERGASPANLEFGGTLRPTNSSDDLNSNRTLAGQITVPHTNTSDAFRMPADNLQEASNKFVKRIMKELKALALAPESDT